MKSTSKDQKQKGNAAILIYIDQQKKAEWEGFINVNGLSMKGLIMAAVDAYIGNFDKTSTAVVSKNDMESVKSEILQLVSQKFDQIPTLMQQVLNDENMKFLSESRTGFAFQALDSKTRLQSILSASKQRVLMPDTLKAALPDVKEEEIFSILDQLVDEGKIQKTNLGWKVK